MTALAPPGDLVRLPPRDASSSKRDYGRVAVAGGAAGMAGAPALAAMAALKSGAGLVELLVPETVATIAASFDPCVMTHGLPAEAGGFAAAAGDLLAARLTATDAAVVGPGIGRTAAVGDLVRRLWREIPGPAVFDADALLALAPADPGTLRNHAGPRVLTPHAGELARLVGRDPAAVTASDRPALEEAAAALAAALDAVVVFKGAGTLVVAADRRARNATGNPGMATAGTGDVLAGVIAALLGQGLAPFDAARLGAWVHGRAGDAAAADLGEVSMTARDLLDRLHVGFRAAACRPL
jgi:ADP-dependent NAD(P)H-hydrate dehydratase